MGRPPTYGDLDYHLTTLFPPVRACGHLEIRYLDAQPDGQWAVPAAAFEALLSTPQLVARATEIGAETAGRWLDAARVGLADRDLRTAATELLNLAAESSGEYAEQLSAASRRCRSGLPPSEFDARSAAFESRKESV